MRVLITVPSLAKEFGGPVGKALALTAALRGRGHEVLLAGAGDSQEPGSLALGRRSAFHGTPIPTVLAPLRRAVHGADVVHVLGFRDPVGTVAALEARRRGVPYVLEPVGMLQPRVRSRTLKRGFDATIGAMVRDGARALIVTSSVERDDLIRAGLDPSRVRVRPNGVSFEGLWPLPERGPLRERLDIPPGAPLVVTLARLAAIKNLPTLVRAVASSPMLHLLIAGPDEGDGTLEATRAATAAEGAVGRVHVEPGGLWGLEKASALAEADVFCLASGYESFGTAAAEAAGVGVPVVLTECCGVKDVLEHAVVVPNGDLGALCTALEQAVDSDRERALSQAADLRERLSWATMAKSQEAVYDAVMRTPR
jgi:glycosyltransferase involved in cell wall biosynthesis